MWSLLLTCVVSLVAAQNASVFSFSGNFASTNATLTTIQISTSTGDCDTSSSGYYYTKVTVPFATAGFRTILGVNIDFVGFVAGETLVLNTTNPCNSTPALFPLVKTASLANYQVAFGHYFPAGNYTFVIASSSANEFVGEFWEGMLNGEIPVGKNATWNPLYTSSSACAVYGYDYTFDAQRFTVSTTGYYTLTLAFSQNTSAGVQDQVPNGVALTLLAGDYSMTNLTTFDCAAAGLNFLVGSYSSSGYLAEQAVSVMLTAGMNYTYVASAYSTYGSQPFFGRFSVVVAPQVHIPFSTAKLFQNPQSRACDGTISGCTTPTTPALQEYAFTAFTVPPRSWFYLAANQVGADGISSVDLEYYVYSEDNSNLLPCGSSLGATCMDAFDSMSGNYFYSGSYTNFSVIATGYYDTLGSDGTLELTVLKGQALPAFYVTDAPTAPTAAPTWAPTPAGQTSAPTTAGTWAPTTPGQTYAPTAPTTRAPTTPGQTYAPTTSAPTSAPTDAGKVSMSALHVPCVALGLALFVGL